MAGVKSKKVQVQVQDDLEPLFDYTRVQPNIVCLDDDDGDSSDGSPVFSLNEKTKNKKKKNTHKLDEKRGRVEDKNEEEEEEDEDDWLLPPPPKPTVDDTKKKLEDDPTLKELRLMKQELQSLAQSAKDSQTVEDSPAETIRDRGQSPAVESLKPPPSDRFKIIISIQDKDGLKQFRVYVDDKFERIFRLYTNKVNVPSEMLTFCFDGEKISPSATPESLGMEDNDIIEVHAKSS